MTFSRAVVNFVGMNRFTAAFFLLLFLTSCDFRNKEVTFVSGTIIHHIPTGQKPYVYLYRSPDTIDILHLNKILTDSFPLDQEGQYHFKITNWHKPAFFDLKLNDQTIAHNYFLIPAEKIRLDFDVSETPARLLSHEFAGKYNRFLQEYSDTFYRNAAVKQFYYVGSNFLLAPEYAKYLDARRQQELDFAKEMLSNPESDSIFKIYLQSEIDYQWANDKTAFLWKKWVRNEEVPLDSSYYNFLTELKIDNPAAIVSPAYIRFLQLYIREIYRQLPIAVQRTNDPVKLKCEIAKQRTSGLAYKVALYHILTEELSNATSLGTVDATKLQKVYELADWMSHITGDDAYIRYVQLN